ncbi:MAG: pyrimidine-nucleoside phosphorylase [bacterium]|nr:pyrimidine-nucleoside phosphorylase [bacterium]
MNMIDIISKKRDNYKLSKEEIEFFINGYVKGEIPDYQVSSLLMAIFLNGLDDDETCNLTFSMLNSGEVMDLSKISGIKADKHSTGGVGDKVSLVLGPIIASFGVKLAKMSGRGLGHTGGTLDKLESIPGFNINISNTRFINQVNDIGLAIIGQTQNLVPADKLLYALRDVTATVDSIPLIASSIMSKKLASGADIIVLDVKVGSGAFMKNIDDAVKLSKLMVKIGKKANKYVSCIITDMDEPLGLAIGNNLEVIEAINTLNGNGPKDLLDVTIKLVSKILIKAKLYSNEESASKAILEHINDGSALKKLKEMVAAQDGDNSPIFNTELFPKSKYIYEVKSKKKGYITHMDALKLGIASMHMGAGRLKKEDSINYNVGIVLNKKTNDYVNLNDTLCYLHMDKIDESIIKEVYDAFTFGESKVNIKTIYEEVD